MKISMICFSLTGRETGERLLQAFLEEGEEAHLAKKSRYLPDGISVSLGEWTREAFGRSEAVIFIGACGIAVRAIAPLVASKKTDPAVLVIDECGGFVISLLSGHLGGANELAIRAAAILGARPVVTTATDLHRRFAVDVFAKNLDCSLFHMDGAKEVSAALLAGKDVGFYSEFPWEGELPAGLVPCDERGRPLDGAAAKEPLETGVAVTVRRDCLPFFYTAQVVPRTVVLGMGCRKGKEAEAVFAMADACLEKQGLRRESLMALASIVLKKEEPGLLALSERLGIPFFTYTREDLLEAEGSFTPSEFVRGVTGVDNVCERSAILGSGQGRLIQRKMAQGGVTAALAQKNWRIDFE
ncbi:MAG: cobalt-precorrin 5A hydrolase [Eubacteriales bacterium]|nr:cobalt-precorrin 5A hydrolase [Eubacteriales bacterium]